MNKDKEKIKEVMDMDPNKVAVIVCVSDEGLYQGCLRHLKRLQVPKHISMDVLAVRSADSMAEGYNRAMKQSDAKYKIYLHQDTFILNVHLITDLIALFTTHPELGLVGIAGCKKLPRNGIWWHGLQIGRLMVYKKEAYRFVQFKEPNAPYEEVQAVDGLFMATQYDVPWQEDLKTGFHFYDTSQSLEFIQRGYKVGVPLQKDPWCLHYHENPVDEVQVYRLQPVFEAFYSTVLQSEGTLTYAKAE